MLHPAQLFPLRLLLILRVLLRQFRCGEIRQRIAPDEMIEPAKIVLHHGAHRLWFGDAVAKAFVNHHLDFDAAVFQTLTQLVSIRYRHTTIKLAMLDQRWRVCRLTYVSFARE